MNPLKIVIPLLLVVGGIVVWQFSPGVRSSVRNKLADLGAWTEEARKEDPEGFMEFAIEKLKGDEVKFKQAKNDLKAAGKRAEERREDSIKRSDFGSTILERMNTAYATAEGGAGYPVAFAVVDGGPTTEYDRGDFLAQVQLTLAERDTHKKNAKNLDELLALVERKSTELSTRSIEIKSKITELETQLEIVKIKKLTSSVESLMEDVYGLLEENHTDIESLEAEDDPVRSLDDLIDAMENGGEAPSKPAPEGDFADALKFLEG